MADGFKPCSVPDCNGNAHYSAKGSRGWCQPHYHRWHKHGDPLAGNRPRAPNGEPMSWLIETALHYAGDDCLPWPYAKDRLGYGRVWADDKVVQAHRWVCIEAHGKPPSPTHEAAHSCGNGHLGCVAPKHLSWKTPGENQADKIGHGTHGRGSNNTGAKLTEGDVREIRLRLALGETPTEVATDYGVGRSTIDSVKRRAIWAWLDDTTVAHSQTKETPNADK